MSQLIIRGHGGARFALNVTQFRSPMSAAINSVQTRKMVQHFPIRAGQPDIQFTVQFPSIDAHHKFRDFVRDHQRNTLSDKYASANVSDGAIILNWPERDIVDWKGYITSMPGREIRFEYAPKVTFGVMLIESLMTQRTFNFSLGNEFWSILGQALGRYMPHPQDLISNFQLPTPPSSQQPTDPQGQALNQTTSENDIATNNTTQTIPGMAAQ